MGRRRFALLAGILVMLNLVLWLAPQGLALRNVAITKLFGPKLVRAEIIDRAAGGTTVDWRLDRGIVLSVTATELTLSEADGRQQTIGLDDTTQVVVHGRHLPLLKLSPGWRVLVTWQANGTDGLADTVKIESRHKVKLKAKSAPKGGASDLHPPGFHLS